MKIALALLITSAVAVSRTATSQTLTDDSLSRDTLTVYATIKTNRAGINPRAFVRPLPRLDHDSVAPPGRSRVEHVLIGGFIGALTGLAISGGIGLWIDTHPSGDAMIPATPLLGTFGAAVGLVSGLLVGTIWPVK
ncbi:MAG: hypothetical protein NVSMB53_07370 [Gemmatimonadaceae bacterium]